MQTVYLNKANQRSRAASVTVVMTTLNELFGSAESTNCDDDDIALYTAQQQPADPANDTAEPDGTNTENLNPTEKVVDTSSGTKAVDTDGGGTLPR